MRREQLLLGFNVWKCLWFDACDLPVSSEDTYTDADLLVASHAIIQRCYSYFAFPPQNA
jgi:hypothetical protein